MDWLNVTPHRIIVCHHPDGDHPLPSAAHLSTGFQLTHQPASSGLYDLGTLLAQGSATAARVPVTALNDVIVVGSSAADCRHAESSRQVIVISQLSVSRSLSAEHHIEGRTSL